MNDETPLEAPVAPAPLQRRPGLIVGVLVGVLVGVYTLAGGGGLDDGWQWADLAVILGPVITGFTADRLSFSQAQADLMAPRGVQQAAADAES